MNYELLTVSHIRPITLIDHLSIDEIQIDYLYWFGRLDVKVSLTNINCREKLLFNEINK